MNCFHKSLHLRYCKGSNCKYGKVPQQLRMLCISVKDVYQNCKPCSFILLRFREIGIFKEHVSLWLLLEDALDVGFFLWAGLYDKMFYYNRKHLWAKIIMGKNYFIFRMYLIFKLNIFQKLRVPLIENKMLWGRMHS